MTKVTLSLSAILGLIGLVTAIQADFLGFLPGISMIVVAGVLLFVSLRMMEKKNDAARAILLETLSPNDVKTALENIAGNLDAINENIFTSNEKLLESMKDSRVSAVAFNTWLMEALDKFHNSTVASSQLMLDAESNSHNVLLQTNDLLVQVKETFHSELKAQLEQQQNLFDILTDDVRNALMEFSDTQLSTAEDATSRINKTMKSTDTAIRDLLLSLEQFSTKNAETIKKSADGYKQFEVIVNKTLEQMTTISNQDYDLLKGFIK